MTELVLLGTAGAPLPVVMPLDARMPDPGALVRATDIPVPVPTEGRPPAPLTVMEDDAVRATDIPVMHGHVMPAGMGCAEPSNALPRHYPNFI
jgi:hypothetical protein